MNKDVKQHRTQYRPLGYTSSDWPPAGLHPADHNSEPSSSASFQCTSLSIYLIRTSGTCLWGCYRRLLKVSHKVIINDTHCSPFIHHTHLIVEGYQSGRPCLLLHKSMPTTPNHLLILHVWKILSEGFAPSPSQWLRWDCLACSFPDHPSWRQEGCLLSSSAQEPPLIAMTF